MENRNECRVEVLTVTPVFLAGADPRTSVELRSPSFRGALRFWFRALLGGVLGDNPEEIFKREREVFGSTDYGSPVIVRVQHPAFQPLPYSDLTVNKAGLAYLLFSARATGRQPQRMGIQVRFQLTCQLRSMAESLLP
ncbi:MAG: type III-B CRISPR module RAMP protein Cmr1, partial [Candidatus Methanomethylicaceae archaeon]